MLCGPKVTLRPEVDSRVSWSPFLADGDGILGGRRTDERSVGIECANIPECNVQSVLAGVGLLE